MHKKIEKTRNLCYNIAHVEIIFICRVIGGILFAALYFLPKRRKLVFCIASIVPLVFIAIRLVYRAVILDNVAYTLQALPLMLCGMTAILLPIVAFSKNKIAFNLNYFISMPATVFAVLLDDTCKVEGWTVNFWCFLIPHLLYLFVPLYMFVFKYIKPEIRMIKWTVLTFACVILVMHGLNSLLSWLLPTSNGFPTTNFIYTMFPGDNGGPPLYEYKNFPLLIQAWNILPVKCVYLILLSPVLAMVICVLSLPLVSKQRYKKVFGVFRRKQKAEAAEADKDTVRNEDTSDE